MKVYSDGFALNCSNSDTFLIILNLLDSMADNANELNKCIQCGTCSASCFSGRVTALNTRKILMEHIAKKRSLGEFDTVWFCVTCYACQERCPRGIPLTDILISARNELVKEKGLPGRLKNAFKSLQENSALVPAKNEHIALRKELGLELYHSQFVDSARNEVGEIVRKYVGGIIK